MFDINDFDETTTGPWEWDVKRLAVSVEICGRANGIKEKDRRNAVARCVHSYSDHIGTANVQTEIILGAFHLCSLFYEVNRVNYLLAKIEELPALDNVRFSLK